MTLDRSIISYNIRHTVTYSQLFMFYKQYTHYSWAVYTTRQHRLYDGQTPFSSGRCGWLWKEPFL